MRKAIVNAVRLGVLPVVMFFGGVSCMAWVVQNLAHNSSASIPKGVYRLEAGKAVKGAIVRTCPGDHGEIFGERGYMRGGHCAGGVGRLFKRVAAVAGDRVTVDARGVIINGVPVAHPSYVEDGEGRELPRWMAEDYVLRPNELFLLGDYRQSLDSRLYGPVNAGQVECCLRRIF